MFNKIKSYIKIIVILGVFSLLSFYFTLSMWSVDCEASKDFIITPGAGLGKVIQILSEDECFDDGKAFKWLMRITGKDREIRPGKYDLSKAKDLGDLMSIITSDSEELTSVTILEGWTIKDVSQKMGDVIKIDSIKFEALCKDKKFIKSLGIEAESLEGYLYPDTYSFSSNRILFNITEEEVIKVLVNEFKRKFKKNIGRHNLSMHEIVTLGSIIQGECVFTDEMKTVSSVYNNRLEKGWLLQADPTIQYLKPGKNKRLYNKDYKRFDSPYNTYIYKGLPPGPISNPGIDAIIAAAYPKSTDYMFFVAKGDGRHYFSKTEREHNNAKNKYLKKVW
tara:strand:+ start:337 stop:1341 length:1005 start_codon:yes stop_codon:yes gene_type:complete